jgi:hypothetical protein
LGIITNISPVGCGLESYRFANKPKETIELSLKHPLKDLFVSAVGEIIWKKRKKDRCFAGMKFREIDEGAKNEILDFAHDRWISHR